MPQNLHFIINPAAGQDEAILASINNGLQHTNIEWDTSITHDKDDGIRLTKEALKRDDIEMIVAYGGDGTVGEVAIALSGTDMPMGILAGGTGNAFARALRIPMNLDEAIQLIVDEDAHQISAVDTGTVNDDLCFIVGGATGLIANTLDNASREEKNRMGMSAYTASLLREILNAEPIQYQLTLDGEEIEVEGVSCFVANAGGFSVQGLSFFNHVDIQDGELDVFLIKDNRADTLLNALFDASPFDIPWSSFPSWRAKNITINAGPDDYVFSFDGNNQISLPVEIKAQPGALKVCVPKDWGKD